MDLKLTFDHTWSHNT